MVKFWSGFTTERASKLYIATFAEEQSGFELMNPSASPLISFNRKANAEALNFAKENNQKHLCFASGDGNKFAYQSKIVGLSSACSS